MTGKDNQKGNEFKIKRLPFLLVFGFLFSCLYYEEQNKGDNSKIYYKDAQEKLIIAVGSLSDRCPSFVSSGFNYDTSYVFMTAGDPCDNASSSTDENIFQDIIKGCSDDHYFSNQEVNLCLASIASDTCEQTGTPPQETQAASSYRFATFAYCAKVFKSAYPMPLFF